MGRRSSRAGAAIVMGAFVLVAAFAGVELLSEALRDPRTPMPARLVPPPPPPPPAVPAPPPATEEGDVLKIRFDAQGRPLDPYGTPYRLRTVRDGTGSSITTVDSAGKDRSFGTSDDQRRRIPGSLEAAPTTK